jgi:tripartite-type tricarboxylate transporter receptor subunit TctC
MARKIDRLSAAMQLPRRALLRLAAGAAALPALSRAAFAVDYPVRPVHIVAAYPPGAAPDIIARLIGQWLSERLGQQFITDNRPGAASNIGTGIVAKAEPDGYTLLVAVSTSTINATLYTNLNFNFVRDLVPIAGIGLTPFIVVVNPQFPAKSIPELIAYAKANPGVVNMATSGVGTGPHVAAELFQMMTGVKFVHVPYRGNYMPDLLSGQVPMSFAPMGTVIEFVRDGRLRALGVTPAVRSAALPDVPAIAEFLPGYEAAGWYGIVAPKGTPDDVIGKLHAAITAGVGDATIRSRLTTLGVEPRAMSTAEFGKFIADETAKWAKVVREANIKPE